MNRVELTEIVLTPRSSFLEHVNGAEVQVNIRDAGAATVYQATAGGATHAQPLTTRFGRIEPPGLPGAECWLDRGSYDFVVTPAVGAPWTQRWEAYSGADSGTVEELEAVIADGGVYLGAVADAAAATASGAALWVVTDGSGDPTGELRARVGA